METPAPCRTLYIRNLPDKLNKQRLRKLLHAAFSPYGRITHIIAEKTLKLRGQAFLTYGSLASAAAALRKMHATQFMGKQITVTFSRQLSDVANVTERTNNGAIKGKKQKESTASPKFPASAQVDSAMNVDSPTSHDPGVANRILFVENLTVGSVERLQPLFARFAGFVEVRGVPGKTGIAFIEYGTDSEAAVALGGLQGHMIGEPPKPLSISFAKK